MLSSSTFIVEMTGIFGAGYAPGLFHPLTALLRGEYMINENNVLRRVVTRHHIDNTSALTEDKAKRKRVTHLIVKAEDAASVTEPEWRELVDLLLQSERRFLDDLKGYPEIVDVAFRRGGRLQDYILFHRAPQQMGRLTRDPQTTPKLQFFLRADLETTRAAFADPHLQQLIRENPGVYNDTPERAYAQQEAWLERVRHLTGLLYINRREVSKDAFARHILDEVVPLLIRFGGVDIRRSDAPHDIFVSYAAQDQHFARSLADAASRQGLKVWFDQFELEAGDSLAEQLSRGIAKARFGVVILSPAFIAKPWTSWAKTEVAGLLARETSGQRIILPVWLNVSKVDVLAFSPPLADILAFDAAVLNVDEIALRLKRKVTRR